LQPNIPLFVREPLKLPRKGRPKTTQTGRILSGFERTEVSSRVARQRCSACGQLGHNRSNKHCPVKIKAKFDQIQATIKEFSTPLSSANPTADQELDYEIDNELD
jgi:hypothetical protein